MPRGVSHGSVLIDRRLLVSLVVLLTVVSGAAWLPAVLPGSLVSPAQTNGSSPLASAINSLARGNGPAGGVAMSCSTSSSTQATCGTALASPDPGHLSPGNGTWSGVAEGRAGAGIAYDVHTGKTVRFGGQNATQALNDTWQYRNGSWGETFTNPTPSARSGLAMTYDYSDGYVLLFGGRDGAQYLDDTWTFQGGIWTNVTATAGPETPTARANATMTYDTKDGYVVLFGGQDAAGYLGGTYNYSAGQWHEISTASAPSARANAGLAYDSADHYVLLFGGQGASGYLADTWKFVGGAWTGPLSPVPSPSARAAPAMAWDVAFSTVVLFGGTDGTPLSDTWEFSAGAWTQKSPAQSPPARSAASFVFDDAPSDVYMLLTGGLGSGHAYLYDTWVLNGTAASPVWTEITGLPQSSPVPSVREGAGLVWDQLAHEAILFGGHDGSNYLNDTWKFIDGTWTRVATPVAPSARANAAMVYYVTNAATGAGAVVLFGGYGPTGYLSDTWEFANGAWENITGSLQAGTSPSPREGAAVAFNGVHNVTVLFGGQGRGGTLNDTWSFNLTNPSGPIWTLIHPVGFNSGKSFPSGRAFASFTFDPNSTYDSTSGSLLIFSGYNTTLGYLDDTWELFGGNATAHWENVTPAVSPSARTNATMAWDTVAKYGVLFGGSNATQTLGDTWEFNGTSNTWKQIATSPAPSNRSGAVLVYDLTDYDLVMFGGVGPTGQALNDTWLWLIFIVHLVPVYNPVDATVADQLVATVFLGRLPYTYKWSGSLAALGCGTPGNVSSVACTPPTTGTFPVTVSVNDSAHNSSSATVLLTVNPLLMDSATVNGYSVGSTVYVDAGQAVDFVGTHSDGTGPYATSWVFGDGHTSPNGTVEHPYANPGTYSAAFYANDSGGASLAPLQFTVVVAGAPTASLVPTPSTTDVGISNTLTATVHGGTSPYSFVLLTGDGTKLTAPGTSSTSENFTHVYTAAGTYTLQLWINDSAGFSAYLTYLYEVNPALASAATTHPTGPAETGEVLEFNGTFTGGTGPYTYAWQFGDGSGSTGHENVTHAYTTAGTYTATFWVNDSAGGSSSATVMVTVNQGPTAAARGTPTTTDVGVAVAFNATATGGVGPYTYAWEFGDGTSSTSATPSHAYLTAGTFTAKVWVNDTQHGSGLASVTVQVNPLPAISAFTASPTSVRVGHAVELAATETGGTGAITYAYTGLPGGCSSSDTASLSCTPNAAGTFVITVTATDSLGKTATASVTLQVTKAATTILGLPPLEAYALLGAIAVLIAAVIVAVVVRSRRRRPPVVMTPTGAGPSGGTGPTTSPSPSAPPSPPSSPPKTS